jgi:hypothetical protein
MALNVPYRVTSSQIATKRSLRVADVRLLSRETTRLIFDRTCLTTRSKRCGFSLKTRGDILANVLQNRSQIQGRRGDQHGWRWDEVTGFAHASAEPRLGDDVLVSIIEG